MSTDEWTKFLAWRDDYSRHSEPCAWPAWQARAALEHPAGEQTGPVLDAPTSQRADEPVGYVNDFGVEVRGYESAMGGLYKSERIALEVSDGVGPCHSLVRFVDVANDVKDGQLMNEVRAAMREFHAQVAAGQCIRSSRDVFFLNVEDVLKDGVLLGLGMLL